jgi:hypothetical protein
MSTKRNIDLLGGVSCIILKTLVGLGIVDLDIQNKCLLSKWLLKLMNEEGLLQEILEENYLKNKTISQVERKKGILTFGRV